MTYACVLPVSAIAMRPPSGSSAARCSAVTPKGPGVIGHASAASGCAACAAAQGSSTCTTPRDDAATARCSNVSARGACACACGCACGAAIDAACAACCAARRASSSRQSRQASASSIFAANASRRVVTCGQPRSQATQSRLYSVGANARGTSLAVASSCLSAAPSSTRRRSTLDSSSRPKKRMGSSSKESTSSSAMGQSVTKSGLALDVN
mmetsp:Transcript_6114/g.22451  ORF Transcript_6114/g.22451 Transcript_6114/m.22451 type:complete len:211 (-) Transcript_6114:961-1593(-)